MQATVQLYGNAFAPASVDIAAGGTVVFTWAANVDHNIVSTGPSYFSGFSDPLRSEGTFTVTFSTPGEYTYNCQVHARMNGVVRVH